jgi:phenylacetate-CoA ligase
MDGGGLYERLPIFAQNLACTWAGWRRRGTRFSPEFHRVMAAWEELGRAPLGALHAFQAARLRQTLARARLHVPAYRAQDLPPPDEDPDPSEAIRKTLASLPVLEKATVRDHPESFVADDLDRASLLVGRTSGTTGSAVPLLHTRHAMVEEWVTVWRQRRSFGVDIDDAHLTFAGHSVVPFAQKRPPYWRQNRALHQTLFSIYHLSPEAMPAYVDAVHAMRPVYVVGYPSVLHRVAVALLDAGRPLPVRRLRALFACSESILAWQRETIERAFGTPLLDRYGSAEFAGSMTQCAEGRLHLDMEFGIAELEVSERGEGWERGQLLLTGFCNDAMPFLRYRIGDIATRHLEPCPCGRAGDTFEDVDGRVEDVVVTPDGREIGRLDHVFKDLRGIREAQVRQERPEDVEVRLVPAAGWGEDEEARLRAELGRRLGPDVAIRVNVVEAIPREANGKLRAVISRLGPVRPSSSGVLRGPA